MGRLSNAFNANQLGMARPRHETRDRYAIGVSFLGTRLIILTANIGFERTGNSLYW